MSPSSQIPISDPGKQAPSAGLIFLTQYGGSLVAGLATTNSAKVWAATIGGLSALLLCFSMTFFTAISAVS